jgi:hypothetical protein
MAPQSEYESNRKDIRGAIVLGLDVEERDPMMKDMIVTFTEPQVDWIAAWLASEGFHR